MATYFEIKDFIARTFGIRDIQEDQDIIIDINNPRFSRFIRYSSDDSGITNFTISNSELYSAYESFCSKTSSDLELYCSDSFEVGIDISYSTPRGRDVCESYEDNANGLIYELGAPSLEYCICLISKVIDELKSQENINGRHIPLPMRFRRPIDFGGFRDENRTFTLTKLIQCIIGELSLRITTTDGHGRLLSQYRKYKTAFTFEFIYKSNIAILEYNNISDMFRMNPMMRERLDISQIDSPPLREYCSDVVDYYKLALSSHDPYIKYISFYHIMEYFFDEVFKNKMIKDLRDKITHPDFSYKNEEKIFEIAKFIKNRWHMNDESGQGDELESLKFVLNEYVPLDELQLRINNIDSTAVQYYKENKVSFSNAPAISWSDTQGVITQLAKRIYFTRNSLVHSKSSKNKERYKPYKDEKQLQKEIPLAKAVAESIIINSSKIM